MFVNADTKAMIFDGEAIIIDWIFQLRENESTRIGLGENAVSPITENGDDYLIVTAPSTHR